MMSTLQRKVDSEWQSCPDVEVLRIGDRIRHGDGGKEYVVHSKPTTGTLGNKFVITYEPGYPVKEQTIVTSGVSVHIVPVPPGE